MDASVHFRCRRMYESGNYDFWIIRASSFFLSFFFFFFFWDSNPGQNRWRNPRILYRHWRILSGVDGSEEALRMIASRDTRIIAIQLISWLRFVVFDYRIFDIIMLFMNFYKELKLILGRYLSNEFKV